MNGRFLGWLGTLAMAWAAALAQEAPPSDPPASAPARAPVPAAAALKEATKLANEVFRADLAKAKTPPDRAALGKKLLQAGLDEQKDPAGRFTLLGLAGDLAAQGSDVDTALAAAEEQIRCFDVDALKCRADALGKLAKARGADVAVLEGRFALLIDEALLADRYDVAGQLADQMMVLAEKSGDRGAVTAAAGQQQDVTNARAGQENAKKALATLAAEPNNTTAFLIVGRYYCFTKGDWEKGLPMLASSGEKALKAVVDKDVAAPAEPGAQLEVADAWWDLAQKEQGLIKRKMLDHAAGWYAKALPGLANLPRMKVEAKLALLPNPLAIATEVKALPEGLRNVSEMATYIASSRWPQDPPPLPSLLRTSEPEIKYAFHTQNEKQPYIIITLPQGAFLRAFTIRNRRDGEQGRADSLTLWASGDGKHWLQLWTAKQPQDSWTVLLSRPVWAKYVKIGLLKSHWLHLSRVELLGGE
ncbi:MAG: discoidin domain-containing protein [Planctomycetota bacterium]|nr:discoidin domain-containing protein [Planctomycetota bacterium]